MALIIMVSASPLRCNVMKIVNRDKLDKSERLTITLGKGQRRRIEAIAKKNRTSAATVIRWALDEYVAKAKPG
jgi:hypothetical protein